MKKQSVVILIGLLIYTACSKEEVIETSPLTRNEVQQELKNGTSVKALLDLGVHPDSLYGFEYQGGFIFYINEADGSGMVVSKKNVGSYPDAPAGRDLWTPVPHSELNVTAAVLGTGMSNTSKIVEAVGSDSYAAHSCFTLTAGGFDDWYLPSIDELGYLHQNMQKKGYSNIPSSSNTFSFWSSTEVDNQKVKALTIEDNGEPLIYDSFKSSAKFVRAVRNF